MNFRQLSLFLPFCLLMFFGCTDETTTGPDTQPEDSTTSATGEIDSSRAVLNAQELAERSFCGNLPADQFCRGGLAYMMLGDSLVWKDVVVEGATVKDTVFTENDYSWNAKLVRYDGDDGRVVLESDFSDQNVCGRIQIETEKVRTMHGIGVGSTFKEVSDTYGDIVLNPFFEYEVIEVMIGSNNDVIFHIADPGNKIMDPEKLFDEEGNLVGEINIPDEARIIRVVLMPSGIQHDVIGDEPT